MVMLLYVGDFLLGNFLSIVNYLKMIWIENNWFVLKNWKCYYTGFKCYKGFE